jgi:epoxide hydrolase-like predicted phosphatase
MATIAIKTIFWDIGGVVLTNGWDEHQRADVLPRFGVEMAVYEPLHHKANALWERGRMTLDAYLDETLFYAPQKFTREEIWQAMEAESKVLTPGWFELAARLRATGKYRMATLNNESRELNEYRLEKFDLRKYFDFFICSGYMGMMKPEPGIYRLALDTAQSVPEETLFVDDKQMNIDAAAEFGMQGIRFTTMDALVEELERLGVTA